MGVGVEIVQHFYCSLLLLQNITLSPMYIYIPLLTFCYIQITILQLSFSSIDRSSSFPQPAFPHLSLIIIFGCFSLHSLDFLVFISATYFPGSGCYSKLFYLRNFTISCHFYFIPLSLLLECRAYSITLLLQFSPNFTRLLLASLSPIIFFFNPI